MLNTLNAIAGFTIEQQILESLQSIYSVIPTANIRTDGKHGPRLEGDGQHITLADGQIFGERRGFVEIKAKTTASYFRNWSRWEHGIDKDKFVEYCELQAKTKMPVYIILCEVSTGSILMSDLDTLKSSGRPRFGTWPDMKESINFDRKVFHSVGRFTVENGDLRKIRVEWFKQTLMGFLSQFAMNDRGALARQTSLAPGG